LWYSMNSIQIIRGVQTIGICHHAIPINVLLFKR